jgi:hypothetical protein
VSVIFSGTDQEGVRDLHDGDRAELVVFEQLDQRLHVVATEHGAEELYRTLLGNQGGGGFALGDRRQEAGLHVGRGIHASGNPIGE